MTEQQTNPVFRLFLRDNPRFKPLIEMFPDGIPVFYVSKKELKGIPSGQYSWKVQLNLLTQNQRLNLIDWFVSVSGCSREIIEAEGVYIPEQVIYKVIGIDGEEINVKWTYLQQTTSELLSEQKTAVNITFPLGSLHLLNLCFCCLISNDMMPDMLITELKPFLEGIESILTKECPELGEVYNCLKSSNLEEAIKQLNK